MFHTELRPSMTRDDKVNNPTGRQASCSLRNCGFIKDPNLPFRPEFPETVNDWTIVARFLMESINSIQFCTPHSIWSTVGVQ